MKKSKKECTNCQFYTELNCTVSTYYAQFFGKKVLCYEGELWESLKYRTTANVRFRWLKAIFTQIAKATSYIRKRCTTFQGLKYE